MKLLFYSLTWVAYTGSHFAIVHTVQALHASLSTSVKARNQRSEVARAPHTASGSSRPCTGTTLCSTNTSEHCNTRPLLHEASARDHIKQVTLILTGASEKCREAVPWKALDVTGSSSGLCRRLNGWHKRPSGLKTEQLNLICFICWDPT